MESTVVGALEFPSWKQVLETHRVGDFPSPGEIVVVDEDSPLRDVLSVMVQAKIRALPICARTGGPFRFLDLMDVLWVVVDVCHSTNAASLETELEEILQRRVGDMANISGRNPFVPVEAGDSVLSSVRFMRDEAKRSPVMKDDIIVNVLTPQNILSHVLQLAPRDAQEKESLVKVEDLLQPRDVVTVREDAPVLRALEVMKERGFSAIPVVDELGDLSTIVTVRDIKFLLEENPAKFLHGMTVFELVQHNIRDKDQFSYFSCSLQDSLKDVCKKLLMTSSHRLVVLDSRSVYVGVLSISDVLSVIEAKMSACQLHAVGSLDSLRVETVPRPEVFSLGADSVLIRVEAAALNPVDWKMAEHGFFLDSVPTVLGCDVAGRVVKSGSNVDVTRFHFGAHVFGFPGFQRVLCGAFQEYCILPKQCVFLKPEDMSWEGAASIPVAIYSAALLVVHSFGLPPVPGSVHGDYLLVWGASGSVGSWTVQLGAHLGFQVIGVCSEKNFDYVKGLGAWAVLDRRDSLETLAAQLKDITGGKLQHAVDTIGQESAELCAALLGKSLPSKSKMLSTLAGEPDPASVPEGVLVKQVLLGTALQDAELANFLGQFTSGFQPSLDSGLLKAGHVTVLGDLTTVKDGLCRLKAGEVSGTKLVVRLG